MHCGIKTAAFHTSLAQFAVLSMTASGPNASRPNAYTSRNPRIFYIRVPGEPRVLHVLGFPLLCNTHLDSGCAVHQCIEKEKRYRLFICLNKTHYNL